jgi:hypothetical protein
MNSNEKVITPLATMQYIDGILHVDFLPKDASLEDAKEYQAIQQAHFSQYYPILSVTDASKMKQVSKATRDYFASPEIAATIKAVAVITGSGAAKFAGNLFLQFSKPKFPTKLFTDFDKAVEWLEQQ